MKDIFRWGAMWHSVNSLNGEVRHLMCRGLMPVLFLKRKESVAWINQHYGYIRNRPDLRLEPHGWRLPKPIKVRISGVQP